MVEMVGEVSGLVCVCVGLVCGRQSASGAAQLASLSLSAWPQSSVSCSVGPQASPSLERPHPPAGRQSDEGDQ